MADPRALNERVSNESDSSQDGRYGRLMVHSCAPQMAPIMKSYRGNDAIFCKKYQNTKGLKGSIHLYVSTRRNQFCVKGRSALKKGQIGG